MADIKNTAIASESSTTGMNVAIPSAAGLAEANRIRTSMASNILEAGADLYAMGEEANFRKDQQQLADAWVDEANQVDEGLAAAETQMNLFTSQVASGEVAKDDPEVIAARANVDRLTKLKDQMSVGQFEIMMEKERRAAVSRAPWVEKRINSVYGDITGRTSAVMKSIQSASSNTDAMEKKIMAADIQYLKDNGLPYSSDKWDNRMAAQEHQFMVQQSRMIQARGTTNMGMEGWAKFKQAEEYAVDEDFKNAFQIDSAGNIVGSKDEILLALDEKEAQINSSMRTKYGEEVPAAEYELFQKTVAAKKKRYINYITGETKKEVADAEVALQTSLASSNLINLDKRFAYMASFDRLFGKNPVLGNLVSEAFVKGTNLKDTFNLILGGELPEVRANSFFSLPAEIRNNANEIAGQTAKAAIRDNSPESQELAADIIHSKAEIIADPALPYTKEDFYAMTEGLITKDYLKANGDGLWLDSATVGTAIKNGTEDAMTSVRDKLSQSAIGDMYMRDFITLNKAMDGTLSLKYTGADLLKARFPSERHANTRKRMEQKVRALIDSVNRNELGIANRGIRSYAHMELNTDYHNYANKLLAELGLDNMEGLNYDDQFWVGYEKGQAGVVEFPGGILGKPLAPEDGLNDMGLNEDEQAVLDRMMRSDGFSEEEKNVLQRLEQAHFRMQQQTSGVRGGANPPPAIQAQEFMRQTQPMAAGATISSPPMPTPKGGQNGPTYEQLAPSLFRFEGGLSMNEKDKGNYIDGELIGTNMGISAPTLQEYLGRKPTKEDMANLTKEEANKIYKEVYWDKNRIDEMPANVREMVFNMFVMTSPKEVVKALQRASGAKEDGILGPQTMRALRGVTPQEIWEEYHDYLRSLKSYKDFGKGWRGRYAQILERSRAS